MTRNVLRLATYRFRASFGRDRGGYLTLILLIGLVGGVAMGAVAGARRTQSSFPVYLASTHPSDVQFFTEFAPVTNIGYSARVDRAIARLPYVARAADRHRVRRHPPGARQGPKGEAVGRGTARRSRAVSTGST